MVLASTPTNHCTALLRRDPAPRAARHMGSDVPSMRCCPASVLARSTNASATSNREDKPREASSSRSGEVFRAVGGRVAVAAGLQVGVEAETFADRIVPPGAQYGAVVVVGEQGGAGCEAQVELFIERIQAAAGRPSRRRAWRPCRPELSPRQLEHEDYSTLRTRQPMVSRGAQRLLAWSAMGLQISRKSVPSAAGCVLVPSSAICTAAPAPAPSAS